MGTNILIINIGSASKKYSIYDGMDELLFFHFEKSGTEFLLTIKGPGIFEKGKVSLSDYQNSIEFLNNYLEDEKTMKIEDFCAISFRIVAPGTYFLENREIDDEFVSQLEKSKEYAGLHIKPILEEIRKAQNIYKDQKVFGISDSAYHRTKLEESKYYGISKKIQDKYDYRRFGYHGISAESVVEKIIKEESKIDEKVLVCHLGGGVSFTALKNGKSMDNSMGFSPLEGPLMATRSGSVDFTLLQDLFNRENVKTDQDKTAFLFEKSGLLGLSGISNDLRILREENFKGNQEARFAIKVYIFEIVKEIAKMISVTKGLDTIVFTGTIGYRADFIRELILEELRWIGLDYDLQKNSESSVNYDYFYINTPESKIKILVCKTDEMRTMSKITLKMM